MPSARCRVPPSSAESCGEVFVAVEDLDAEDEDPGSQQQAGERGSGEDRGEADHSACCPSPADSSAPCDCASSSARFCAVFCRLASVRLALRLAPSPSNGL